MKVLDLLEVSSSTGSLFANRGWKGEEDLLQMDTEVDIICREINGDRLNNYKILCIACLSI